MPSGLCDRVRRILPLAKKVANEIVSEETEILKAWTRPPPPRWYQAVSRLSPSLSVVTYACPGHSRVFALESALWAHPLPVVANPPCHLFPLHAAHCMRSFPFPPICSPLHRCPLVSVSSFFSTFSPARRVRLVPPSPWPCALLTPAADLSRLGTYHGE